MHDASLLGSIVIRGSFLSSCGYFILDGDGGNNYSFEVSIPVGVDIVVDFDCTLSTSGGVTAGVIDLTGFDADGYSVKSIIIHRLDGTANTNLHKTIRTCIPAALAARIASFEIFLYSYVGTGHVGFSSTKDSVIRVERSRNSTSGTEESHDGENTEQFSPAAFDETPGR